MDEESKKIARSFMGLCKEFFGFKAGQTLFEFRDELKALTPEDREDLKKNFEAQGYVVKD